MPDGSRRVLLGLLLGALFIRIGWWALYAGIIENEGVEYARLASNWFHGRGYVSAFGGTHTLFPPLYPLLIGLATPLAGSEAAAARLVSVLAGVLLVWALARLGTECFNPLTGMIAGVLGAVHPLLVALSASTYSESLYLSLITVATLLAFRSVTRADWRLAACTGALLGAAYLTRPEGLVLAGPMAVIVAAGMWRKGPWIAVRQAAILGITVCLVAAPYIVWLSHLAGRFRWEGKSGMNNLIVSRVRSGLTFCQASRGLDSTGRPVGPYLIKDQSQLLKSEIASAGRLLEELTRSPIQRARTLATHVRYAEYLSVPIILLLVAIGLLFTRWWREQPVGGALLIMVPAVAVVVLLTLEWIWQRYLFVLLPAGLIWAAAGLGRIASVSRVATILLATTVVVTAARPVTRVHDFYQTRQADLRAMGDWIQTDADRAAMSPWRPRILGNRLAIAYYAQGELVYHPCGDEAQALRYVHAVSPDYLVLRDDEIARVPYAGKWFSGQVPDSCAVPVTTLPPEAAAHYKAWRWRCARPD